MTIRLARPSDAEGIQAIYAPFVADTVISFETEVPSIEQMAQRVVAVMPRHPWLVVDQGGAVAGYAYGGRHRDRQAYGWSVDVSAYVSPAHHRRGLGRGLYAALLEVLRAQGYHQAYAGITLPNAASVGLHEAVGFVPVGAYRHVGWKLGSWHDVGWWQRSLQSPEPPQPIRTVDELSERRLTAALAVGQHLIQP
ncbi:MAG: arsinothricin resistance N-acetyltransferase ArsN1 family B [Acidimicrobiales bacterium]